MSDDYHLKSHELDDIQTNIPTNELTEKEEERKKKQKSILR